MHIQAATRPSGLSLMVVLYDIGALFGLAVAGLSLLMTQGTILATASFIGIVIYLDILIFGHFLWKGYTWARIVFMLILALDLIRLVPNTLRLLSAGVPAVGAAGWLVTLLEIVLDGLFLAILASPATRQFCRR